MAKATTETGKDFSKHTCAICLPIVEEKEDENKRVFGILNQSVSTVFVYIALWCGEQIEMMRTYI